MTNNISKIQELLREKADRLSRLNLMPYDGTPEIKTVNDSKYLYVRKRVGSRKISTYVGVYSEELYQLLVKNAKERRELNKAIKSIDKQLQALQAVRPVLREFPVHL